MASANNPDRPSVIIRQARPDDAEQLIAHVHRLCEEPTRNTLLGPGEFTVTPEEEQRIVADYAAADNCLFLVAEVEGSIVGVLTCAGGKRRAVRHAVNLGMSVRQGWRNRGIGTKLMAEAIRWAEESGVVRRIELQVNARNTPAVHLYEKFGFAHEGRRRNAMFQDGEFLDDFVMAKVFASHS